MRVDNANYLLYYIIGEKNQVWKKGEKILYIICIICTIIIIVNLAVYFAWPYM